MLWRDADLCIDQLFLSPSLKGRIVGAGVDRAIGGWQKASGPPRHLVEIELVLSALIVSCSAREHNCALYQSVFGGA
jgi:hypothetical protein